MFLQQDISLTRNSGLIGIRMNIMIDRYEDGNWIGRTEFDSPEVDNEVIISGNPGTIKPGMIKEVIITGAEPFDLNAEFVEIGE
jgi:ribosomal protein S12 methylthiotransferase